MGPYISTLTLRMVSELEKKLFCTPLPPHLGTRYTVFLLIRKTKKPLYKGGIDAIQKKCHTIGL